MTKDRYTEIDRTKYPHVGDMVLVGSTPSWCLSWLASDEAFVERSMFLQKFIAGSNEKVTMTDTVYQLRIAGKRVL